MLLKNVNKLLKYNNVLLTLGESPVPPTPDPYNPLNLPAYTIRVKCIDEVAPLPKNGTSVLVDEDNNIWDITYENSDWSELLKNNFYLKEVLGANTTGVTNMYRMFYNCPALIIVSLFDTSTVTNMNSMFRTCRELTNVPLFVTSNVTDMSYMFYNCEKITTVPLFDTSKVTNMSCMLYRCTSLITSPMFDTGNVTNMSHTFEYCGALTLVPLFNTSKVTNMDYMFSSCFNVESGALALYQQASTQTKPPTNHEDTFWYCGRNTETGAAELSQIAYSWK